MSNEAWWLSDAWWREMPVEPSGVRAIGVDARCCNDFGWFLRASREGQAREDGDGERVTVERMEAP